MSYSLKSVKGVNYTGGSIADYFRRVTKGDTRSIDYSSNRLWVSLCFQLLGEGTLNPRTYTLKPQNLNPEP